MASRHTNLMGVRKTGKITVIPGVDLASFVHPERVPDKSKPHEISGIKQVPGTQAIITPVVADFAAQFHKPRTVSDVASIVAQVRSQIRLRRVGADEARELYAKRTATDVIHSKSAMASGKVLQQYLPMYGCVDHGLALTATLRALDVPAFFGRRGHRTLVFFRLKGKNYVVDPSRHTKDPEPRELTLHDQKAYQSLKDIGGFNCGRDAWSIGITSIRDFNKYVTLFDRGVIEAQSPGRPAHLKNVKQE